MINLDLCEGPECPNCGCRDTQILRQPREPAEPDPDGQGVWFSSGQARCKVCRTQFAFRLTHQPEA